LEQDQKTGGEQDTAFEPEVYGGEKFMNSMEATPENVEKL
jgi:hypothetical protein